MLLFTAEWAVPKGFSPHCLGRVLAVGFSFLYEVGISLTLALVVSLPLVLVFCTGWESPTLALVVSLPLVLVSVRGGNLPDSRLGRVSAVGFSFLYGVGISLTLAPVVSLPLVLVFCTGWESP